MSVNASSLPDPAPAPGPGGELPDGLSLNATTGTISGTPTVSGTFYFMVKATNGTGSAEQQLSIAIAAAPAAPIIKTALLPGGTTGTTYSQTLEASGTAPITWSIASGGLPSGLSLDPTTGMISGTPTAPGTFNFTVGASNSLGSATPQTLSITIYSSGSGNWIDVADTSWYEKVSTNYTIRSAEELAGLAKLVNSGIFFADKTITLTGNIDLAGRQWTPIGKASIDPTNSFQGTFDGGGHTISNMTIVGEVPWAGLFGYIGGWDYIDPTEPGSPSRLSAIILSEAEPVRPNPVKPAIVKNVNLVNVNMDINMIYDPSARVSYFPRIGGIAGYNVAGSVLNCTTSGNISCFASSGYGFLVGGIVGDNATMSDTVSGCTSSANVSAYSGQSEVQVGGIVGINSGTISECTSSGSVSGSSYSSPFVGGIVAQSGGTVSNCHKPSGRVDSSFNATERYVDNTIYVGGVMGSCTAVGVTSGNDFSQSATGQTYGIGWDGRHPTEDWTALPSNDGATPLP